MKLFIIGNRNVAAGRLQQCFLIFVTEAARSLPEEVGREGKGNPWRRHFSVAELTQITFERGNSSLSQKHPT